MRATLPAAGLAAAGLGLAACSGDQPATSTTYTASAPVIQPGRPGEPATTVSPGQTGTLAPRPGFNDADVTFARDMIRHHAQAIQLSGLAPGRAADARVVALASRISAGQTPEIAVLRAWLTSRGQLVNDPDGHGHTMAGMATPAQVEQLEAAGGTAFDRLFVTLMVTHHRGAVAMSNAVMTTGTDPSVRKLATEISSGQSAEIGRLLDVGRTLR